MTTVVQAKLRRSLNYSSFADITTEPLLRWTTTMAEFNGTLSPTQVQSVWARMESSDDADQAARADLRTKLNAAVATTGDLAAVKAALRALAKLQGIEAT